MSTHGEPWRKGLPADSIVCDLEPAGRYVESLAQRLNFPTAEALKADDLRHYGGYLVAESMEFSQRDRAIACVNLCAGVDAATLERIQKAGGLSSVLARVGHALALASQDAESRAGPGNGWGERRNIYVAVLRDVRGDP